MKTEISHITQHLFNKNGDVSEQELREFTEKYPYAVAGHILLTQKLVEQNAPSARDQVARAALYLHDPLWLNLLLEDGKQIPAISTASDMAPTTPPELLAEPVEYEKQAQASNQPAIEEDFNAGVQSPVDTAESFESSEEPHAELVQQTEQFFVEKVEVEQPEPEVQEISEPITEEEHQPMNTSADAYTGADRPAAAQEPGTEPATAEIPPTSEAEDAATQPANAATGTMKDIQFEPYHTIDYFASQGIRLQQSEFGKDKIGQQLKSFTEWLRSMKRLPQSEQDVPVDSFVQQSISRLAAHSLDEREVITEAMAEVWWKQGNLEKAAEIYNKLKLLNPSKSHYFAAKIEALKNH